MSSLYGIWTHTINTLQHHSLSLTSSALDHSTTSAPLKWSFNNRSVTFSRKENLEIHIRHVSSISVRFKPHFGRSEEELPEVTSPEESLTGSDRVRMRNWFPRLFLTILSYWNDSSAFDTTLKHHVCMWYHTEAPVLHVIPHWNDCSACDNPIDTKVCTWYHTETKTMQVTAFYNNTAINNTPQRVLSSDNTLKREFYKWLQTDMTVLPVLNVHHEARRLMCGNHQLESFYGSNYDFVYLICFYSYNSHQQL